MSGQFLRPDRHKGFTQVVGVGGIGTGIIFALEGDHTLGRNESRLGRMVEARDYCKLHIAEHYIAVLMGSGRPSSLFRVIAVGNVGRDPAGERLLSEMNQVGIDTRYVTVEQERGTLFSVCFLYPDLAGGNITASNSAADALASEQLSHCRKELEDAGACGIALCLPEVPLEARREYLQIATESKSFRVASFTSAEMESVRELALLPRIDLLSLNRDEAFALVNSHGLPPDGDLLDACSKIASVANPKMKLLLSAGSDGAHVFEDAIWTHHKSAPVDAVSTAGAGDALLAGVLSGLAAGMPLRNRSDLTSHSEINTAIDLGISLASLSVTSPHSIHPKADFETLLAFAKEKELLGSALQREAVHLVANPMGTDDRAT